MKTLLAVLAQTVLFFLVFAVFSFVAPFGVHWFVTHPSPTVTRYFVADGFLLASALGVLILLVEMASKRLRGAVPLTLFGYVLAMVAGYGVSLGFLTHEAHG